MIIGKAKSVALASFMPICPMDRPPTANKVTNWGMEMGSPNGLMRAGWTRNTLHVGDVVRVEGSQAKDGTNIGNARAVTTSEGKRLFAASSQGESTQK